MSYTCFGCRQSAIVLGACAFYLRTLMRFARSLCVSVDQSVQHLSVFSVFINTTLLVFPTSHYLRFQQSSVAEKTGLCLTTSETLARFFSWSVLHEIGMIVSYTLTSRSLGDITPCNKIDRPIVCLLDLTLYVPVNTFSVMSGRVFHGWTSNKQGLMCIAQGHNAVSPVRLEPTSPRSRVKHSTTEALRSLNHYRDHTCFYMH